MLNTLRQAQRNDNVHLDIEFHRDVQWFSKFAHNFNGTAFYKHEKFKGDIDLDASLQGLGAKCGSYVYAISIPLAYENYNIVHLEMLYVLVALRTWGHHWKHKALTIDCDNQTVVTILTTGYTRDMTLAAIARNIRMLTAQLDLEIKTMNIPGKENIIDTLSRLYEGPQQTHPDHARTHLGSTAKYCPNSRLVHIIAGCPSKLASLTRKAASTRPLALADSTPCLGFFLAFCVYYHIPTNQVTTNSLLAYLQFLTDNAISPSVLTSIISQPSKLTDNAISPSVLTSIISQPSKLILFSTF